MAKTFVDLNDEVIKANTSLDNVIIPRCDEAYSVTLDTTGITEPVLTAGHIIVKNDTGVHYPQKVSAGNYVALTAEEDYAGVLSSSILTKKPFASVMSRGTVNIEAAPYKPLADAEGDPAFKVIRFTKDV